MELAPSKEPWTSAVAWARPWHRPVTGRPAPAAARGPRRPAVIPPAPTDPAPVEAREATWTAAVAELRAAREALAELAPDRDDPWPEVLARQRLFRARRQVLRAQEALTGTAAELPWSTC